MAGPPAADDRSRAAADATSVRCGVAPDSVITDLVGDVINASVISAGVISAAPSRQRSIGGRSARDDVRMM